MGKQLNIFNDAVKIWQQESSEGNARDYNFDTLISSNQFLIVPTTFLSVPSSNGEVNPANSTSSENGLLPPALHNL